MRVKSSLTFLPLALAALLLTAACASIGRPEGGERDMIPPRFVRSNPNEGALNVSRNVLNLFFDENIQLDDPANKIIVSPPQKNTPAISSNGRRIRIELRDSLIPNTTYTVDFADAIRDLNESNILDGFAFAFSTGESIDTLAISGMVLEAHTLEPAQGMLVGLYDADTFSDTTLTSSPMVRVTKTNQLGQFTLRNLRPGNYRVVALNDVNRDYQWDRSEDIAFLSQVISPSAQLINIADTLTASDGRDSLAFRQAVLNLPNDLLLTWFNEEYKPRYLVKNERPDRRRLYLEFAAPAPELPSLTLLNGPRPGESILDFSVIDANAALDSLTFWITDSLVAATDTLIFEARYLATDSLGNLSPANPDTLRFAFRPPRRRNNRDSQPADTSSVKPLQFLSLNSSANGTLDLDATILLSSLTPISSIDSAGVHLETFPDSVWVPVDEHFAIARIDSLNPREFFLDYALKPSVKYRLTIDSAAVVDIYGLHNRPIVSTFSAKPLEDYASLFFNVKGLDSIPAVVELLRTDSPIKRAPVIDGVASFTLIPPGPYYARLFLDADSDGQWTTGNVMADRQPEEVFYYPKKIQLKKNWDVEQVWDIYSLPVDLQKPLDIKKNKPKKRKWDNEPAKPEEESNDDFFDPRSQDPFFHR